MERHTLLSRHPAYLFKPGRFSRNLVAEWHREVELGFRTKVSIDNPFLKNDYEASRSVPSTATNLFLEAMFADWQPSTYQSLQLYLQEVTSLGCLTCRSPFSSLPFDTFRFIQLSFPNLTTLILTEASDASVSFRGHLNLERLEVLSLDIFIGGPLGWHLPSLRHLGFGAKAMPYYFPSLVLETTHRLLSFCFPGILVADTAFWDNHAALQFLGISISRFRISNLPPRDHSLSFLLFLESKHGLEYLPRSAVSTTVDQVSNLKTVVMPSPNSNVPHPMYPEGSLELYREHASRGLRWCGWKGNVIHGRKRKRSTENGPIEEFIANVVYFCVGFDLMKLWSERNGGALWGEGGSVFFYLSLLCFTWVSFRGTYLADRCASIPCEQSTTAGLFLSF